MVSQTDRRLATNGRDKRGREGHGVTAKSHLLVYSVFYNDTVFPICGTRSRGHSVEAERIWPAAPQDHGLDKLSNVAETPPRHS